MEISEFSQNGIKTTFTPAPRPLGKLTSNVIAVVGVATKADDSVFPLNTPVRVSNATMAAKLDTDGTGEGYLVHFCEETLAQAHAPIYVIRVDKGSDDQATKDNIIGGVSPSGQKTGIEAIINCLQKADLIVAPGYSGDPAVALKLGAMSKKLGCRFICDLPGGIATDVITSAAALGNNDTGFGNCIAIAGNVHYTGSRGQVTMPPSVVAAGVVVSQEPWEGPGHKGVPITGLDFTYEYSVSDPSTDGNLLNKNGVCYFASTSAGGFSLIGNRVLTGRFISQVGLIHAMSRKITKALEPHMGKNLTKSFMDQQVTRINAWLESLIDQGAVIPGTKCYLHPELNNLDEYKSGAWHIVVEFAGYSVNELVNVNLVESNGIIETFIEGVA